MTERAPLDRLCAHLGILADAPGSDGGPDRPASDHARRQLLRALGIDAGDAAREQRSLDRLQDQAWRRRLPPVAVVPDTADTLSLPLTRPADDPRPIRWRLTAEDGSETEGLIEPASLPVDDRRTVDGRDHLRHRAALPLPARAGYHRLRIDAGPDADPLAAMTLIAAPEQTYQPEWLANGDRRWGIAAQLETLRSARNWGVGDFTDLTRLIELTADAGADAVALAPLHTGFPRATPERTRPWSQQAQVSSRLWPDPLYLDVELIPELRDCEAAQAMIGDDGFQAALRALRAASRLDRDAVAAAKLGVLERIFADARGGRHAGDDTGDGDFEAFRRRHENNGSSLERLAIHQVLVEHFAAQGVAPGDWPEPYRDPRSAEVAAVVREHRPRVDFFVWLHWQAQRQLRAAVQRAEALGLAPERRPGLVQALAPGIAATGAEAWSAPGLFIDKARIAVPPDAACPSGRLTDHITWHPTALREAGYAPLAELLGATMRQAHVLRLDALLALLRPYLVPEGNDIATGAYLAYPIDEVLAVLALESSRQRCAVVGGELDRLPEDLSRAVTDAGVLPARVLYDAREGADGYIAPQDFADRSLILVSTDERPSLTELWQGVDLERRRNLGLFADDADADAALVQRSNDRVRLLGALDRAELLPAGSAVDPIAVPVLTPAHVQGVHRYLARSPARLMLVQAADLLSEHGRDRVDSGDPADDQPLRLTLDLEHWLAEPGIAELLAAVRAERESGAATTTTATAPAAETASHAPVRAAIPRATYRLQLHAGFGFADAADLVPYLDQLGISHCYFSPYMQARPGSTHGYDVVAHDQLNPELGSRADFDRLCETLADHGMGQLLDMVPNHVGVMGGNNRWWLDVLENGQASRYANWFDIDWEPLKQELRGKVLVPVLGDHYGNVLDNGELRLVLADGGFRVEYYEHHFPIDPREYPRILAPRLEQLRERLDAPAAGEATGAAHQALAAFESLITAFGNLPSRWQRDAEALTERRRDKEIHKQRLAALCAEHADIDHYVRECLRDINGSEHAASDRERLHALLEAQAYRLAHWRVAADEINYRRFFDINDLAALRMENPDTFEATHGLVLALIADGRLDGLRIDHPDGLYDPAAYFAQLQRRSAEARGAPAAADADDEPWSPDTDLPLYLVVEKILTGDEQLPEDWPVHGTTGYDFAALSDALLVDPDGAEPLTDCWQAFSGRARSLEDEIYASKRLVMRNLLSGELNVLASELSRIAETDPHTRDFTLGALRDALMDVVACFPVYRTYITARGVATRDRNQILKALAEARRRSRAADISVFDFVGDVLLTDIADGRPAGLQQRALGLAMKLQQYTSPVTAKGVEDTALYRWHRLVSLNDVGGEPERFGLPIDAYHRANARRRERWPHALLTGSTHDSKRSEDLRARLHVLSELPQQWRSRVERWARINRRFRRDGDSGTLPDGATEYLFYQILLGVWPLQPPDADGHAQLRQRVGDYMQKAVKEAKVHTSWTNANEAYEEALAAFVEAVLDPERNSAFFEDFLPFQQQIARLGLFNALSQTLLRLTVPGVPDIYQGNELWRFDLVDPDNRRPVDFARRRALLDAYAASASDDGPGPRPPPDLDDAGAKLHLIRSALQLRRDDPALFSDSDYEPLTVTGPHAERLCAFARTLPGRAVIVLAPRLLAGLAAETPAPDAMPDPFADAGWADTLVEMPAGRLEDRLAGGVHEPRREDGRLLLSAADVLRRFPAGLLLWSAARE
jgi:(1->4)-alpha-D-glucan 1-alpha-D-glucosylmutase